MMAISFKRMCFCETKQFDMAVAVVYNDGGFFEKQVLVKRKNSMVYVV